MYKVMCALIAACCAVAAVDAAEPAITDIWGHGADSRLYPKDAFPYGKSISGWADRSVQWMYAQPFDHNPFFDATGAKNRSSPVFEAASTSTDRCGSWRRSPRWRRAITRAPAPSRAARPSC